MRKLILLFFSFWLILANSCTLKSSTLPIRNAENNIHAIQEIDKSSSQSLSFSTKTCKVCAEQISAFIPVFSKTIIKQIGDFPILLLKSILLLGFLFFFIKIPKFINLQIPHRFNSRLYLQLKRIQIYA